MWPKNIRFYTFTQSEWLESISPEVIDEALSKHPAKAPTALQEGTFGWVLPFRDSLLRCEAVSGCWIIAAQTCEKILPASVINDILAEKLDAIEEVEGRRPVKKEREQMKEEIRAELLPKAFVKTKRTLAWIDPKRQILAVCAASEKMADDFTANLRDALGSLSIVPVGQSVAGADVLTQWYLEPVVRPAGTEIEANLELSLLQDPAVNARYKNLDLNAPEIKLSLESGMRIRKLSVSIEDQMTFSIDERFALKQIKYASQLIEQANDSDDPRADTLLMLDSVGMWSDVLNEQITDWPQE